MESPNKKKLRSGVRSTVGGGLGGSTYKTASPYNIKTSNMNTNGLSPLMQAAVGGEAQTIPGGQITQTEQGFMFSPGEDMDPIPVQDPKGLITGDGSTDYLYEETENGFVIVDVANVEEGEEFEEGVPGSPDGPGANAGMGMPEGGM